MSDTSRNLYSAGTTPEVLSVSRRLDNPNARSSCIRSVALTTFLKLYNGSPIPIRTTLVIARRPARPPPSSKCASQTCAIISAAVRLRLKPCRAVAQNEQSRIQPTWDETHSVPRSASGIKTVSTQLPPAILISHLRVPSTDCCRLTISGNRIWATPVSRFRKVLLKLLIAAKSVIPSW